MSLTNIRPFLWIALGLVLFLNYQMWQRDYAPPPVAETVGGVGSTKPDLDASAPVVVPSNAPAAGSSVAPSPGTPAVNAPAAAAPVAGATAASVLKIRTDVLNVDISLRGGEIVGATLPKYPLKKDQPDVPVILERNGGSDSIYVLQSGLAGAANQSRPTHLATYTSEFGEFTLLDGVDTLRVPLTWTSGDGITVTKTFVFHRGGYRIDLEYAVRNDSAAAWEAASYTQIKHETAPVERSYFNPSTYAFEGPAIYDGTKYRKLKIDKTDDANYKQVVTHGWIAALQHHFASAIVPQPDVAYQYSLSASGHQYLASMIGPMRSVAPQSTETFKETLFIGPKLQRQLDEIHPELSRVADYGTLTFLAKPLFSVLEFVHKIFGNWGVSIILTTLFLKVLFYPLSEASGKSMARMKTLGPRMKQLQETYKDDREKLGRAMMDLYKREKVNPAFGCLPILIQFPVFIAFYWVLLESVEMRQAPFIGWLKDLSSPDPFYILPVIMAGAMFFQYKLQPTPADPVQAKVFMILPFVMSATFVFFPSGLVLYWVTNTLLTIAQQWNINRRIEAAAALRR